MLRSFGHFEKFSVEILHFFLWVLVKSRVYANNPEVIHEFKSEIQWVFGELQPHPEIITENFMETAVNCHHFHFKMEKYT